MDKSRLRTVALIVAGAMFMHNLDSTLIATSLPQIGSTFGVRAVDMSVGITAYLLASAAFLPLAGWLADRYSARRVFAAAVALFTLASVGCGAAGSLGIFVLARVAQGVAGAMMTPVGQTVVLRHTEGKQLLTAIALLTWPGLLAPVIAPVLGGMVTTYFSWRWNFLLNIPIGLAVVVLALKMIPAEHGTHVRPLDVRGLAWSTIALTGLLYGLQGLAADHGNMRLALLCALVGAAALAATFRHLRRTAAPLLDLATFRYQTFRVTNGTVGLVFRSTIAATPFLVPLLLQLAYGFSALQAGSWVMVYFLGNVAMKPATSPLLRRFGFRNMLVFNGVLSGLATIACGFIAPVAAPWLAGAVLFLTGLTRSMQFTSLNTLGYADMPAALRSSAATLNSMLMQVSMALGVAVAALLLQRSALLRGAATPELLDFRVTFALVGLAAVVAAIFNLALPRNAGAHVTAGSRG
jgi:EmrB/QacA subfamily drug resistance transporter